MSSRTLLQVEHDKKFHSKRLSIYQLLAIVLSLSTSYFLVSQTKLAVVPIGLLILTGITIWFIRHQYAIFWGVILTTPFNDHLAINLGGLNLRTYTFFIFVALITLMVKLYQKSIDTSMKIAREILPIFFPIIALSVSKVLTVYSLDTLPAGMTKKFIVKFVIIHLLLYQLAFVTAVLIKDVQRYLKAIKALLHMANIIVLIAILQIVLSNVAGFHFVHHRDVIFFGRPYSVFREPDVLASFVAAIVLIVIPMYYSKKNYGVTKKYLLLTLCLQSFLLVILLVRAAWLASIFTFIFFLVCLTFSKYLDQAGKILKKVMFVLLGSSLLLAVLAPSIAGKIASRFGTIVSSEGKQESAKAYRKLELQQMYQQTLGKGISGDSLSTVLLGYGDFSWSYWAPELLGDDYDQDAEKNAGSSGVLIHPGFNFVLSIMHDNGIIGVSMYLIFLYILFRHFWRKLKNPKVLDKHLLLASYLPIMVLIICFVFSYDPITPFFWVLVGLYLGVSYQLENVQISEAIQNS